MIFNEIFIGRIPEIEEMNKTFGEARDLYMDHKIHASLRLLSKFESQAEDLFGFYSFSVSIIPDKIINAYCYPVSGNMNIDPYAELYTDSKGYHFKKSAKLGCITRITSGLFCNTNFTNDELFAVFLHEVGHNFVNRAPEIDACHDAYRSMVCTNVILTVCKNIIFGPIGLAAGWLNDDFMGIMSSTNVTEKFMAEYNKIIKKIPLLDPIRYGYHAFKSKLAGIITAIPNGIGHITGYYRLLANINKGVADQYNKNKKAENPSAYSRSLERLSDDFVTTYGFGIELSRALLKMGNDSYSKKPLTDYIPGLGKYIRKTYELQYEYCTSLGSHPSNSDRIFKIQENLKHDLKTDKSLNAKEKAMIQEQLKDIDKIINDGKKLKGELAKYPNQYIALLTQTGFINGTTERKGEKKYTDPNKLDDAFDELHEMYYLNKFDL